MCHSDDLPGPDMPADASVIEQLYRERCAQKNSQDRQENEIAHRGQQKTNPRAVLGGGGSSGNFCHRAESYR